jgi:hypothetical protein
LSLNGPSSKKDAERAELARLVAEYRGPIRRTPSVLWATVVCDMCGLRRTITADYAKRMVRKFVRCGSEKIRVSY